MMLDLPSAVPTSYLESNVSVKRRLTSEQKTILFVYDSTIQSLEKYYKNTEQSESIIEIINNMKKMRKIMFSDFLGNHLKP